ncbi:MAG: response regulator [Desulfobacterales bacterium]|nr:response regulator [Desulfobacterales bacterium]MCP4160690.1 response regulator [Deltaproteobacteria bacterium]
MAIIKAFSAGYCKEDQLIDELYRRTNFRHTSTDQIVNEASILSGMNESKVRKALMLKTSVFEKFTHEKKYALAYIKLVISKMLMASAGRDLILSGYPTQLIPREITHFFRIGLIADMPFRIATFLKNGGTAKDPEQYIRKLDIELAKWMAKYCGINEAFNPTDYDLIIPMNTESVKEACDLITENLNEDIFQPTERSTQAIKDFSLLARVEVALAKKGHDVTVYSTDEKIRIAINKDSSQLNKLKKELWSIVELVDGVRGIKIGVDGDLSEHQVYRKYDKNQPSKVLLVDDEQDFVKTLSERLTLRNMGSAVVHDGRSALNLIEQDDPHVMVLDMKMPGESGIDILRKVKETHPSIEVIILTGHGSEEDKNQCLELGAFDYLHKPLNITELSNVIKKANEKAMESSN